MPSSRSNLTAKFTTAYRLLRINGFDHVVHAENISDRFFKVFFVNNIITNARLGIIAGKKTIPCSTDRNRTKRIIRETFRQHSITLCNLDIVVMVKQRNVQDFCAQVSSLKDLFGRVESKCALL